MSGADFLDDEALQAAREDRDERDLDESDEVLLRALDDGIQPSVAVQLGKGPFNHPADAGGNEPSVSAASNCLDGDAERLTRLGQPLAPVAARPASSCPPPPSTRASLPNRRPSRARRR